MKLIFHIGAGKTGTSSIQKTLKAASEELFSNGIFYTGLLFENIDMKLYEWQNASKLEEFHSFSPEQTEFELSQLLKNVFEDAEKNNIHTIIWSNESFFGRMHKILPVLKEFEKDGHEIQIISYVRRHDSWARSAYVQWGLKHKTYKGKLQPFSQWIQNRKPNFSQGLQQVLNVFPESFLIRNMDTVKDVVGDFLAVYRLDDLIIEKIRDNESPKNEELVLRALFNNHFTEQVLPKRFDNVVGKDFDYNLSSEDYLSYLLPSHQGIKDIQLETKEDREKTNALLIEQGQEPLVDTPLSEKLYTVDEKILTKVLCDIVVQQSLRIEKLENIISAIDINQGKKS